MRNMKINFCLPPARLAGGPLAIMEYANGLLKRGHKVTITTYPMSFWPNDWYEAGVPFPWYDFKGEYIITDDREYRSNLEKAKEILLDFGGDRQRKIRAGYPGEIEELAIQVDSSYEEGHFKLDIHLPKDLNSDNEQEILSF